MTDMKDIVRGATDQIWLRYRERMKERVAVVENAVAAARAGSLDADTRAEGAREAHKLAGSLGTFGIGEGTVHARALEEMLGGNDVPDVAALEQHVEAWRALLAQRG